MGELQAIIMEKAPKKRSGGQAKTALKERGEDDGLTRVFRREFFPLCWSPRNQCSVGEYTALLHILKQGLCHFGRSPTSVGLRDHICRGGTRRSAAPRFHLLGHDSGLGRLEDGVEEDGWAAQGRMN